RAGVENAVEFERSDEKGELKAKGFWSMTASHSRGSQFIFVNSRPLSSSPLQRLINILFQNSTFSRHASSHLTTPLKPSSASEKEGTDSSGGGTKASRKSPKKAQERYPIFVLNLVAPSAMVDVTLEPEKRMVEFQDEKRVHAFVEEVVKTFLRSKGFLSTPALAPPPIPPPSPFAALTQTFSTTKRSVSTPPPTNKKQKLDHPLIATSEIGSEVTGVVPALERVSAYDMPLRESGMGNKLGWKAAREEVQQCEIRVFPLVRFEAFVAPPSSKY
ncbi:hypothetical protein P7C70_g9551, partial [Phenoliferia sp. Uapishka_3]